MENVEIVCYTDTEFDSTLLTKSNEDAGISVYSVYSGGKNCTLNYVNYLLETTEQEAAVKTLASVTNYGNEAVTQDISLYMDGQIQDVQELTIASGETTTIYFKELSIDREATPVLTAELSDGDSLTADNACKRSGNGWSRKENPSVDRRKCIPRKSAFTGTVLSGVQNGQCGYADAGG